MGGLLVVGDFLMRMPQDISIAKHELWTSARYSRPEEVSGVPAGWPGS
jgi:hypothetical protein